MAAVPDRAVGGDAEVIGIDSDLDGMHLISAENLKSEQLRRAFAKRRVDPEIGAVTIDQQYGTREGCGLALQSLSHVQEARMRQVLVLFEMAEDRRRAIVVADKSQRVASYHRETLHALAELIAAAGLDHPSKLQPGHFMRRDGAESFSTYAEIYGKLQPGALLREEIEIELESRHQAVALPAWIGTEVTTDKRFYNSALTTAPYTTWAGQPVDA